MSYTLAKVRFLNSTQPPYRLSPKTYSYLMSDELTNKLIPFFTGVALVTPSFTIVNESGYSYRDNQVIFVSIEKISEHEARASDGTFWFHFIKDFSFISSFPTASFCERVENPLKFGCIDAAFVPSSTTLKFNSDGITIKGDITSGISTITEAIDELREEKKEKKNNSVEKENNMFDSIKNSMQFGPVDNKQVCLSVHGPAFSADNNTWMAYRDGKLVDVTGMTFNNFNCFYMMPVAKNAIKTGDFIRHQHEWVRVNQIYPNGRVEVERFSTNEAVTIIPSTNLFGFDFYTKLISFINFDNFSANGENPFGMLPMMMTLNEEGGSMKEMMEMMMMATMFNGSVGAGTVNPFENFTNNPFMLMMFMDEDKKGRSKNFDKYMPLLMMMSNPGLGFPAHKEKCPSELVEKCPSELVEKCPSEPVEKCPSEPVEKCD